MINIEINWIKENIRIEDDKKNTYGVVRFSEVDLDNKIVVETNKQTKLNKWGKS